MQRYFNLEIFHAFTTVAFIIIKIGLEFKHNWNIIKSAYSVHLKKYKLIFCVQTSMFSVLSCYVVIYCIRYFCVLSIHYE